MASGILGTASVSALTDTTVYTVPVGKTASVTISLCNRSSSDATKVRIALSTTSAADDNYIEYDANVPTNGILERSAIVLGAGTKVIVRSVNGTISAVVFGIEE